MRQIVTKSAMIAALGRDAEYAKQYVGRALVALFNRQLEDEKSDNKTKTTNFLGFSKSDAKSGSITAKYFLKHRTLLDWQLESWTKDFRGNPRIVKYHRQLNEIANRKADK